MSRVTAEEIVHLVANHIDAGIMLDDGTPAAILDACELVTIYLIGKHTTTGTNKTWAALGRVSRNRHALDVARIRVEAAKWSDAEFRRLVDRIEGQIDDLHERRVDAVIDAHKAAFA